MANRELIRKLVEENPETAREMVGLHAKLLAVALRWIILGSFWGKEVECLDCPPSANRIRQAAKGGVVHQWQIDLLRKLSCVSCRKRLP